MPPKINATEITNTEITATEANRHFSKLLRAVQAGEAFTITSHGQPVAALAPVAEAVGHEAQAKAKRKAAFAAFIEEMSRRPALNLGKFNRDEAYER